MFGPFMVTMCVKCTFKSFIDFSASDWYNKVPISLFSTPETPKSMISGCLNASPSPKTNYFSLGTPGHLTKIKKKSWHIFAKNLFFVNMGIQIFENVRQSMHHVLVFICYSLLPFFENSSTSFVSIKCEDEDRK